MSRVLVYHNTHASHSGHVPFLSEVCDRCRFFHAYSYGGSGDLDEVFRRNQAVDGSEENVAAGARSLSVGDLVRVDGEAYVVDVVGFRRVEWSDRLLGRPTETEEESEARRSHDLAVDEAMVAFEEEVGFEDAEDAEAYRARVEEALDAEDDR